MKIEIVTEKDNPLRKRKCCWLSVEHPGKETPSRYEVLPEVVKKLGAKEELVVIAKIFSERGDAKSAIKVLVYKDKKDILPAMVARQERKVKAHLEKNDKRAEEPAAAPAEEKPVEGVAEAKPEEAPAEEGGAKEEPPAEETAASEEEKPAEEADEKKPEESGEDVEPEKDEETRKDE